MNKDKNSKNKFSDVKNKNNIFPFSGKSNTASTLNSQKSSNTIFFEKEYDHDFNHNFFKQNCEPKSKSQPTINDFLN